MGKYSIPGPAFLIVGTALVLMSAFIDPIKLSLFILAGAAMIVYGFIKTVMHEKEKNIQHIKQSKARHAHKAAHNPAAHHPAQHHSAHQGSAPHDQAQKSHHHQTSQKPKDYEHKTESTHIIRCSSCGVKLHHLFKFCPSCGQKLK